ncbi:MAG: BMP family ABC transporter substrate-binding protein [Clostridiaceae bacterium]|jgi:basic membrane lipoprotein Med (substrate-binding protein (PBP1-ABC) superfamily)|nr:BMP family ABC transporter substrate-binding protein [Clostridiaceae bacterium]
MKPSSEIYKSARRRALREYSSYISQGRNGYLPFLDGVLKNIEIATEVDLGIIELPVKKVKGTYTHMRSTSFSRNYLPLIDEESEFASKWIAVYEAQINEGLRDPIKAYEYLNWFYVVEGNKRISVLKYLDVDSYNAHVTRMIPKYDEENKDIRLYYAFLKFYKKTGLNEIWFSDERSFEAMWKLIRNYEPPDIMLKGNDRFKFFRSAVYRVFRKVYHELGGQRLPITTGDAFLDYLRVNGVPEQLFEDDLKPSLQRFILELDYYKPKSNILIETKPVLKDERSLFNRLTTIMRHDDKIKVGFALAKDIKTSSWSYAHELGRMHLETALKDNVETVKIEQVPESIDAYERLSSLVEQGCEVIFSTSPEMINATLKLALNHPDIVFLNCSNMYSFKHVRTYFGRIHEPRFLSGVIAGALTKSGRVGYIATCPTAEVISGANAFGIGVKMVNPNAEVSIDWTCDWDNEESTHSAGIRLARKGADILSHHNTLANRKFSKEYGVYTIDYDEKTDTYTPGSYLCVPVWNWGIFYEKIVRGIMEGGIRSAEGTSKGKIWNYWWGMDSGILDFFYSKKLIPLETQKLIDLLKDTIIEGKFNVFLGPLYDQKKTLRIPNNKFATREEIFSMDYLLDFIEGVIPDNHNHGQFSDLSTGKMS